MPEFVAALPKPLRAHAAGAIDFAALAGRVVAVLGACAFAFDNAATALEPGAAEVHLFCPELAHCAHNIAQWQDRYTPPAEEVSPRLGEFPYLNRDSCFAEKRPGETPWIRDIHLFGIGTSLSFGPAGSLINAMSIAAPRVAAGVTRGLFATDLPRLWDDLRTYDVKQVVLDPARVAAE
jgi:hypothetical protein